MITKRDKATDVAARDERDSDEKYRKEWDERATRDAAFQGDVDPASMVISPHTKPKIESETKIIGAHTGDPARGRRQCRRHSDRRHRDAVAGHAADQRLQRCSKPTTTIRRRTTRRPTPTTSTACTRIYVPPEGELPAGKVRSAGFRLGQDAPPIETRTAVEVFPPERDDDIEPPRKRTNEELFPPEQREPVKRRVER